MIPGAPSSTALGAAMMRAAHLLVDDDPKILVDDWAERFLDHGRRARLTDPAVVGTTHTRWSRANLVARSAFTEELLLDSLAAGCRQYVLLGAGLDSSAVRHAEALRDVATFEVDHPDTQQYKRHVLAGLPEAEHISFVPVDFERDSLVERLRDAGWDPHAPTFWSWLGVTMYLTDDAVFATLRIAAACPPGSVMVTNYAVHEDDVDPADVDTRDLSVRGVAAQGEPFLSWFRHRELVQRTAALGFADVESLDHTVMDARYFAGRTDGLTWRSGTAMLVARC